MNHSEAHFSFTQLRRKPTKGSTHPRHPTLPLPLSIISFSPCVSFVFLHPLFCSHPTSHVCVPVLCVLTVSVSHVSPQLWRTAGSSWWISLTTNCACLCPMCHSPMKDAMCASSTQILLRKPTPTSLSWVGVRNAHAHTHTSHPSSHTFLLHPARLYMVNME